MQTPVAPRTLPRRASGLRVEPVRLSERTRELLAGAAAMAIPLVVALFALRVWDGISTVPWYYGGAATSPQFGFDENLNLMLVKGLLDHGWWFHNPDLGAPFGQQLFDYPVAGNAQVALLKLLGLGGGSPGTVLNEYFLLTFPLTGLGAYASFRWLRISRPTAVVVASLFALLPYHFVKGEPHVFLTQYAPVAFGAFLVLAVMSGRQLFTRRAGGGRGLLAWGSWRSIGVLALCAVIATTETYYAVFTVFLLVPAALVGAVVTRGRRPLVTGAVLFAAILGSLTLSMSPSIVYSLQHGKTQAEQRTPRESEINGLKLAQMVVPSPYHRVGKLAHVGDHYLQREVGQDERAQSLGLVGTVGFAWLLAVALLAIAGAWRGRAWLEGHRQAATAALLALLIGAVGGGSMLFALFVSPQIRTWSRLSVFIAFFALFAVALGLDALRRRLHDRRRGALLWGAALAAVLVIGVFDQTTPRLTPDHHLARARFTHDAKFVRAIEQRMPAGTMIFQVPWEMFPENHPDDNPLYRAVNYDLFKGYLTETGHPLRWSFGSVRLRPQADWQQRLDEKPISTVLPAVASVGFRGLWLDRNAYRDHGAVATRDARRLTGVAPLASGNGRLLFYDLRPYAARLQRSLGPARIERLRRATLGPAA